jgi:CheY-like chemotaxis protein
MTGRMGDFSDLIPLTDSERRSLLNAMDDEASASKHARDRRVYPRWTYRAPDLLMVVEHPGGGMGKFLVQARNLSAGGMGFLHGGYLHPGACCRLLLPRLDGIMAPIAAIVVNARHLRGVTHEIGVRFSRAIEAASFIEEARAARVTGVERFRTRKVGGRALYLALTQRSRDVLTSSLDALSIEMGVVETVDRAVQRMGNAAFDLLFIELDQLSVEHDTAIRRVREAGRACTIIVLTADGPGERIAAAREAGASYILPSPPDLEVLHPLVVRLRETVDAGTAGQRVYSERDESTDSHGELYSCIESTLALAHRIEAAIVDDEVRTVIETCEQIHALSEAACFSVPLLLSMEALADLNRTRSIDAARTALTALHAAIHRLGVRVAAETSAAERSTPTNQESSESATPDAPPAESAKAA